MAGPTRYPHLRHFLSTEFVQDPNDTRDLPEVARDFRASHDAAAIDGTVADIRRFLHENHNDIETAFDGFGPQVEPAAYGVTTAGWLSLLADLLSSRRIGPDV